MRRKLSFLLAFILLLLPCASALGEGFEGFDVVIIGDDSTTNQPEEGEPVIQPSGEQGEGLTLTVGDAEVLSEWQGQSDGMHAWVSVNVHAVNWSMEARTLSESIQATLTYQGEYDFTGTPVFSLEKLGMLEELDGQLVFEVPNVVALGGPDALTLTVIADGAEQSDALDITKSAEVLRETVAIPFEYDLAESSTLQAVAGVPQVLESYQGVSEEVARWLVFPVSVINWSHKKIALTTDAIEGKVVYSGSYGFVGTFEYPVSALEPLEVTSATLAVRVPTMVTRAEAGMAELWLDAEGFELREGIDMEAANEHTQTIAETYEIGSIITFGHYEQDNDSSNGVEPIEWRVLGNDGKQMLLISEHVLDSVPYNTVNHATTWETCTLRKWLNNDFLNVAFTTEEKARLVTVTATADKNPKSSVNPGNDTQDVVFLLSCDEVNRYFSSDQDRKGYPTAYAEEHGAKTKDNQGCWWWLRTSGSFSASASGVSSSGSIGYFGITVSSGSGAVRPVIVIRL